MKGMNICKVYLSQVLSGMTYISQQKQVTHFFETNRRIWLICTDYCVSKQLWVLKNEVVVNYQSYNMMTDCYMYMITK